MITIFIPTFQRPELLKRAIQSALDQTYSKLQVCVCDNASPDKTEEIVANFMKADSRVKYFRHKINIGMMANYDFAFSQIHTPYFSILSDDDYLKPNFCEEALKAFECFPDIGFCACGVTAINENEQLVSNPTSIWSREGYFKPLEAIAEMIQKPLLPPGILFSKRVFESVKPDLSKEIQMRWDTDFILQIVARFPFFLNKKDCAIFLSHANGYSTQIFRAMNTSPEILRNCLLATNQMQNRLLNIQSLPRKHKNQIKIAFFKEKLNLYTMFLSGNSLISNIKFCIKSFRTNPFFLLAIQKYIANKFISKIMFIATKLKNRISINE